jgi:hypothetical protein
MKYIMYENEEGHSIPMLFAEDIVHSDFARRTRSSVCRLGNYSVVSAGFVWLNSDGVVVGGESTSLDLKSQYKDTDIIRNELLRSFH